MLAKTFYVYLSVFLLLFPFKLTFGSEFKKVNLSRQESIQVNKNLRYKSDVPETPPRHPGKPTNDSPGGGTRGGCPEDANESPDLTLLIPDNGQGLTVAEYPTFLAFVPETKAKKGEFILYDRTEKKLIYRTTFELTGIPGIVSIQLPKNKDFLKIGNDYEWRFLLQCKSNDDRSEDVMKIGKIKRVAANEAIANIQSNTDLLEKARVYQENKIWYDALQTLAELRPTADTNTKAASMWQEILRSEQDLNEIVSYPLVDCCKPAN